MLFWRWLVLLCEIVSTAFDEVLQIDEWPKHCQQSHGVYQNHVEIYLRANFWSQHKPLGSHHMMSHEHD